MSKYKKYAKLAANSLLRICGKVIAKNYDLEKTILISSTGRSGSTWLAEMVSSMSKYHVIYEPFHQGNKKCSKNNIHWNNYIEDEKFSKKEKKYIKEILTGEDLSTRILNKKLFNPTELLGLKGYVVKSINANMMLNWICDNFPIKGIFLVRHPCAVVASQLLGEGWSWANQKDAKSVITIPKKFIKKYPNFEKVYDEISSPEEARAFEWAMQNYIPLKQKGRYITTTYEWLVRDRKSELKRIFSYINKKVPKKAFKNINKKSVSGSSYSRKKSKTEEWKKRLSKNQITKVIETVKKCGISEYSYNTYPDFQKAEVSRKINKKVRKNTV